MIFFKINMLQRLKEVVEKIQEIMDELREEMVGLASLVC